MERRKFSREFKLEAVKLVVERGVGFAQAARDLDLHVNVLRKWFREQVADPQQAFPGKGQMKPEQLEIDRLRKGGRQAQGGARYPKKSRGLLRQGLDMIFGFVAKHRAIWPVSWICETLGVSRSGFFAWLNRSPSKRAREDAVLLAGIRTSFAGSDRTYGARRVWHDVLAEGLDVGLHRIERLMHQHALRVRLRRRGLPKDAGQRYAASPNILDRAFDASAPNQKWVADFIYIWTAEGWLYVAAVIDLYSRRVVGWSMSPTMTSQLVTDALIMAIWRRCKPDSLLHHSDQGSQYSSEQFQRLMADHGITCSISRSGNVWDNAAMENFSSSLKTERTARKVYRTRDVCQGRFVRLHRALLQP